MIKQILSIYRLNLPSTLVYMLQASEYDPEAYLKWFWRVTDFRKVIYRKQLVKTRPARLLLVALWIGLLAQIILGFWLGFYAWQHHHSVLGICLVIIFILAAPIVWGNLIVLPLLLGRWFLINPTQALKISQSRGTFKKHQAVKIAIAGSYGKTTMKEILHTVLSQGKKVKATPANKNVSISHASFAKMLNGDEDILIIEYGEGAPGDVKKFVKRTSPDIGIITGLAPVHLDKYKTLEAAGRDIFSMATYLGDQNVYVNGDSLAAKPFINKSFVLFGENGIENWTVNNIKNNLTGLSFQINGEDTVFKLKTRLLGRHLIGPLVLAAYLAQKFGLSKSQIETGIAKVEPFEHRMRPYQLSGAWIIDDTYNGNIDGMKAGLALLKELPAKRKIYVTPGLVDQGRKAAEIHHELGQAIALAAPDIVVLMKHSVTHDIVKGLGNYSGELKIEDDPLDFYNHLDKFVAAGDLVLMQNDWPDNYN